MSDGLSVSAYTRTVFRLSPSYQEQREARLSSKRSGRRASTRARLSCKGAHEAAGEPLAGLVGAFLLLRRMRGSYVTSSCTTNRGGSSAAIGRARVAGGHLRRHASRTAGLKDEKALG